MAGREKRLVVLNKSLVPRNPRKKHKNTMQNHHILLLLWLPLMLGSTISTPSPPTQQLNNIIDALIGAGDFTKWVSILTSGNTTILPISATIFVPHDAPVDSPPPDPLLLPYHIVPQRLPFSDLLLLPRNARLPTLLSTKFISVTDNRKSNFSLDTVPLTHPDLFSTPALAVHGVQNFLDYSRFADATVPPPPPFLPIGDAIGTDWNSGASSSSSSSCSRLRHLVFLSLFCFLLTLML